MPPWAYLPAAVALDLIVGDPRWLPHPVALLGRLIAWADRWLPRTRLAGLALWLACASAAGATAWGALQLAALAGPGWATACWIALAAVGLASRSLAGHALAVARPLASDDLPAARRAVGMIVGRDTDALDADGVARAAVESVAENSNDGVIAPLFYLALGGPAALWVFKATSTLDSMVGYRDERYRRLGWASARADDLLGLIPARLTALAFALVAPVVGGSPWRTLAIAWRDGQRHPSPNAGVAEAAAAGALGLRLGGPASYRGEPSAKQLLHAEGRPPAPPDIGRSVWLMLAAALLLTAIATGAQALAG